MSTVLGDKPKVIRLSDARRARAKKRGGGGPSAGKQRIVLALCLECSTRWFGTVFAEACLLCLQCPMCGEQNSFATFLPTNYFDTKMDHEHVYTRKKNRDDDE